MGYAQSGLRADATMVAPQFVGVGESELITLESIVPTGSDTSDNVNIRVLLSRAHQKLKNLFNNEE